VAETAKEVLSSAAVVDVLGLRPVTIDRWCRAGRLASGKIGKSGVSAARPSAVCCGATCATSWTTAAVRGSRCTRSRRRRRTWRDDCCGKKRAEITLLQDGERAISAVTEYGIGIRAARQVSVFEPYVRADNATAGDYGAIGLGPSIGEATVDRHGGTRGLASEEGAGSTFTLSLPRPPPVAGAAG